MPIPTTTRRPGAFIGFDVVSSQRGLTPVDRNVALIGAKHSSGSKDVEQPYRVLTEAEADEFFGVGSELALMCRWAIKAAAAMGKGPALYGVPVADPGGGTKAIHRLAVAASSAAAGDVVFKISGRSLRAGVAANDTAATIAAAMKDAVDTLAADLPVTCSLTGGGSTQVDLTAVNAGVNGAEVHLEVVSAPSGVTITVTEDQTAGAGAYDISNALASLVDRHYHAIAVANKTSTDVSDLKAHADTVGAAGMKKWAMCYLAETGTLSTATTLGTGANQKEVIVISAEDFPNMPGEIAAAVAAVAEGEEDVALSFNDVELPLYLPPPASVPTTAEIETALAAGVTPLSVNKQSTKTKIVRLVTTKTDEGGAPFWQVYDVPTVRTLFMTGIQLDIRLSRGFPRAKKSSRTKKRVRSVVLDVLKSMEELEWLQNVDAHKDEILVEDDLTVPTRLNVEVPASVIPILNQLDTNIVLFLE